METFKRGQWVYSRCGYKNGIVLEVSEDGKSTLVFWAAHPKPYWVHTGILRSHIEELL